MAKYGSNLYSSGFKYGQTSSVSVYYNAQLAAWSYDYGSVQLTWGGITADPTEHPPTHWRLIKNFSGTPDDTYDGILLAGGSFATFTNTYLDIDYENVGKEVSYSIWAFNGTRWIFCGEAETIIVGNDDTLTKIVDWLPKAWLNPRDYTGDALGEADSSTLINTLSGYAFMYDRLRSEASLLSLSFDKAHTPLAILKPKVVEFGFDFEAALGDGYNRSLYGTGNIINSYKGNSLGVNVYTSALTHWTNKIEVGHNVLLDYNDSSFEESIGRWVVSSGTLVQHLYSNSLAEFGVTLTPPVPYFFDANFLPRAKGFAVLSTTGTSTVTMSLPSGSSNIVNYASPVKPDTRYVFSGWVKHLENHDATVRAAITWYDGYGNSISTTTLGPTTTTTTSWQEFTSISDSGRNGVLSPYKAVYAGISIQVHPSNSSSNHYVFDMLQLSKADVSLEYQDARLVEVYLKGEFENLIPNPTFERGVGGWIASATGSFAQDPTIYNNAIFYGSCVGELTFVSAPAAGEPAGYISSEWFPVTPGENYTFSAYLSTEYPNLGRAIARIEFSNRESLNEQVTIHADSEGQYYDSTVYYVDSDPVTLTAHTVINPDTGLPWVDAFLPGMPPQYVPTKERISVSAIAPEYSKDSGMPLAKISIYYPDAHVGETTWIDGALFENSPKLNSFFCGDGAPSPSDPVNYRYFADADSVWEKKTITNLIENPSFEIVSGSTVTNWTAASGTTLTRDAGPGVYSERPSNPDGTYQNTVIAPLFYTPLYGSYMGKVTYNIAVGASISTTVYLPRPAIGGEDFVVSASVRAAEGVYTIATSGNNVTSSTVTQVFTHDQFQWIGLHTVRQLAPGETSFTLTISIAPPPGGYWPALPTSDHFHIDGVQAEYGNIPNAFVNPAATTTRTLANPGHTASTMYVGNIESSNGGKSSYFSNYTVKHARLRNTLDLIMPKGSTWRIKSGYYTESYPDLTASLIPSASFEKDLGEWSGTNAGIYRVVSRGSLFHEHVTHAGAYCSVKKSGSGSSFGIKSGHIDLIPNGGFYTSVALRPANSNSTGTYVLRVDFYDAYDNLIVVYVDAITGAYTTASYAINPTDLSQVPNTLATDAARTKTVTITSLDRWAYVANTFSLSSVTGASYAVLSVTHTGSGSSSGQEFHIDRCVFRQ